MFVLLYNLIVQSRGLNLRTLKSLRTRVSDTSRMGDSPRLLNSFVARTANRFQLLGSSELPAPKSSIVELAVSEKGDGSLVGGFLRNVLLVQPRYFEMTFLCFFFLPLQQQEMQKTTMMITKLITFHTTTMQIIAQPMLEQRARSEL